MSPVAGQLNLRQNLLLMIGAATVTLMLLVATGSLGVAGIMLNLFIAVPAAYVHMRSGTVVGVGAVILVVFGSYLFNGLAGIAGYLLQFGMIAILLPSLLRRGWNWDRAVAVSVAAITLGSALLIVSYANVEGHSVSTLIDTFAKAEVEQAMALYAASDMKPEQLQELNSAAEQMADYLRYAYPGLVVLITGFLALLLLWILHAVARGNYQIRGTEFALWKAPELLVWPLIAAGFASVFIEGESRQISVNLLIVLLPIYFLQGLAIVTHFFNRRKIPPFMRGLGYILIAVLNPMPLVITGLGVFDLWIDFRKPRVKGT